MLQQRKKWTEHRNNSQGIVLKDRDFARIPLTKKPRPLIAGDSASQNTTPMRAPARFCRAATSAATPRHNLPQQRDKARPIQQKLPGDIKGHPQGNTNRKLQQWTNGQM